ncbi:MAG: SRPBCC family protein [Planctomycetota bacterium]
MLEGGFVGACAVAIAYPAPMRRFQTDDARLLEFPPARVFRCLADFEDYNRWWPRDVRFRVVQLIPALIGTKLEVLVAKRSFYAEVVKFEEQKSLHWVYRSGFYKGQGTWTLEEIDGHTRLRYVSDLPVHPSLIAEHFLNAKDFAARHARVLNKAFSGFEKRLEEIRS